MKTIPGGEETPGSKTAVIDPKPLKESCPNPASIARGSRRSITASRGACVRGGGRFVVFRRFTGSLLEQRLGKGPTPSPGIHRRKSFHFRQGIGSRWTSRGSGRAGIRKTGPGKHSPRAMSARRRGLSRLQAMKDNWRSNLRAVPDRSAPTRPDRREARTMATIPARTPSGRRCQTTASSATSVGIGSASTRLPNRSARAAVTPATAPPEPALLRPPYPVFIRRAGRQRLPGYGGGRPR